ncbi:MAG: hypothetical protein ABJD68_09235 [Nakamurella sp.]
MAEPEEEQVVAPGGRRAKSTVRKVEPGQAVTASGAIIPDPNPMPAPSPATDQANPAASMFPAGTSPRTRSEPPAPDGVSPTAGMFPASSAAAGSPRLGASEDSAVGTSRTMKPSALDDVVLTPGGYRPRALVHEITPGNSLDASAGPLRQLHPSGDVVAQYSAVTPHTDGRPLMPGNVTTSAAAHVAGVAGEPLPTLGEGWISYAYWTNNTGSPVTRFATTWIVPPAPATDSGQTIFLFNGIQNSTMIYQPVLQWGPSAAGGGSYWAVASWYADGQTGTSFHSSLVQVNQGDVLVGVMTLTARQGNQFSYNCVFTGIANSGLPITNVDELTWNIETLEAYGVQQASDYPNTNFTAFYGVDLQNSVGHPALSWTAVNAVTDVGQSARVVSNSNPGGEVDIYYNPRVAASAATATINSDGRLEVFLRRTDGDVFDMWQTRPHAGPWSKTIELGGVMQQPLVAELNSDGRLEIFGIGNDNAVYNNWQTAPHAGPWSGWNSLGGWLSKIVVAKNSDDRLEVFGIGGDNALYSNWQTAPHAGPWSGWNSLGGWVKDISVSLNTDGRLEVFAIGADNAVYNNWQTAPHAGPWSGWNSLGGWVSQIASTCNSDGRLEVFAIGGDNGLYSNWQTAPHAGPWSGWNSHGGWVSQISAALNSDGRLEVFGIGGDQDLYDIWQTAPHSGPWSGWNKLA